MVWGLAALCYLFGAVRARLQRISSIMVMAQEVQGGKVVNQWWSLVFRSFDSGDYLLGKRIDSSSNSIIWKGHK
jgi:hypothetical protein